MPAPPLPAFETIQRLHGVALHPNGSNGQPFYVVRFDVLGADHEDRPVVRHMLAIVGTRPEDEGAPDGLMPHTHPSDRLVAVIDVDLAARAVIGSSIRDDNRWRGASFQRDLVEAVRWYQATVDS